MKPSSLVTLFTMLVLCSPAAANELVDPGDESIDSRLEHGVARIDAGEFYTAFHGRVQVWGGWVGDDALLSNGDRMQKYGLRLRRVRLGMDGGYSDWLTWAIELDVFDREKTGGPLHLAWVDYNPIPYFGVTVGLQKFPLAYSEIRSSTRFAHLDRAVGVIAMSPGNTLGLSLYTEPWPDHLRITAGVFNGLQRKPGFFEGYEGVGVSLGNKFEGLSFVGRVDLEPLKEIGDDEADVQGGFPRLSVGGGGFYNDGKSIKTMGAAGHVHLKAYGFHLLAETMWERVEPQKQPTSTNTVASTMKRLVGSGSVGYFIDAVDLGIAVRTEYIDDNMDIDDEGDQVVLAGSVTWYAVGNFLKLQLEYQHRHELHGRTLDNDYIIAGVQAAF